MKRSAKITTVVGMLLLSTAGIVGPASATPPSSPPPGPDTVGSLPVTLGQMDGPVLAAQDGIALLARDDIQVRSFILKYEPGQFSGWHSHPGLVIANVVEGTVVRKTPCKTETFTKGQAFMEVGPHNVSNNTSVVARLAITQLIPKGIDATMGPNLREDVEPEPVCRRSHDK